MSKLKMFCSYLCFDRVNRINARVTVQVRNSSSCHSSSTSWFLSLILCVCSHFMLSRQTLSAWSRCGECCNCKYWCDCGVQQLSLGNFWDWPVLYSGRDGVRVFYCPVNMAEEFKGEWTDGIGVKWYFNVRCTLRDKAVVGYWMETQTVVWVSWWDFHHVGLWEENWLL